MPSGHPAAFSFGLPNSILYAIYGYNTNRPRTDSEAFPNKQYALEDTA